MTGAPLQPGRDTARTWAEQELRGAAYRARRPSLVQQVLHWLADRLSGLHPVSVAPPVGITVIALVVLAVAGIVVWRAGGIARSGRLGAAELFGATARSAADHRAAADAAEAAGDLASAVLERFRALIRALADRDLVPLGPGLTADEAARLAGRCLPEMADDLRAAAQAFDDVCYGDRPARREQVAAIRDLDQRADRARPRPLPAAAAR